MKFKRSRTIEEKIQECLDDKVQNLHPDLRDKLFVELQNVSISSDVAKCKSYVSKLLSLPETGKQTKQYWISRGWSDGESHFKSTENVKKGKVSPYSKEFWTSKINPNTGVYYTDCEADYERNSRRPIRKEYWLKKGYNETESIKLAKEKKEKNNIKGAEKSKNNNEVQKVSSKRCIEYWTIRGFSEVDAREKISQEQSTFTLEKCIEKYGKEGGKQKWLDRQEKWQGSLDKKSNSEKIEINRKKATKINYRTLWNKDLTENGILYLLKVTGNDEEFYKIGITTKSVYSRYCGNKIGKYDYEIVEVFSNNIHKSFILEQKIIKENRKISYIPKQKFEGWTECFYEKPIINYN
jgi:hypothetical protein